MGSWTNQDGLFLQFGTAKATVEQGGDYKAYGEWRDIEVLIDLTTLTTSAAVVSNTTSLPYGNATVLYDSVEVQTIVGATVGTSFSVGTGFYTANASPSTVTSVSDTAFVNALVTASVANPGQRTTMTQGSTSAGGYIGTPNVSTPTGGELWITAKAAGTFSTGKVLVRIRYKLISTITQ